MRRLVLVAAVVTAVPASAAEVTPQRLINADKEHKPAHGVPPLQLVMRGHSASKTRVNALLTRASIFLVGWIAGSSLVKPGNDDR